MASTRSGRSSGGSGEPPSRSGRGKHRSTKSYRRRRIIAVVLGVFLIFFLWLSISLFSALSNPSYGVSYSARFAEWGRQHDLGGAVNWLEKEWYALNPPTKGGKPPANAFKGRSGSSTTIPSTCPGALPAPTTVVSPATPALLGEGVWVPAARWSAGCSAIYETSVRPDAIHTSYVTGIVWMDPKLISFSLYSGSQIPGGGPYAQTAPINSTAAMTLVSAFNAGFRMGDSQGGYYTDNKVVVPLRAGTASAVIYRDGTMTVGAWGTDAIMTANVVAVRQNLDLIVYDSKPAPGLNSADNSKWGATLGGSALVWRSGIGVTANGAIVYVGGPALSITNLADLLVRAGAIRAMELDINTDWVQYSMFSPGVGQAASPANGKPLLANMSGGPQGPARYFATWWTRDFFTTSARYPATATMTTSTTSPHATTSRSSSKG